MPGVFRNSIQIRLQGPNNITYTGVLTLRNDSHFPGYIPQPPLQSVDSSFALQDKNSTKNLDSYDQNGASYYVIAVVLVYGMSIVMLIASHIRRRHAKMQEDKQINKYLHDFQIVKDKQERDNYKQLKKGIVNLLHSDRPPRKNHRKRRSLYPLMSMGSSSNSVQDLSETDKQSFSFRRYSFINRGDNSQVSDDRPSIGRRLSLGFLSLMAPRTSSKSGSFNLHSSQNIIEEDEESPQGQSQDEHRCSTGSEANPSLSNRLTAEKREPSYIDLPAITITAHQARISHQRRRNNINVGLYDDHVPFKDYMEKRVQESQDNDSTDDQEQKDDSTESNHEEEEQSDHYSLLQNEDNSHTPEISLEEYKSSDHLPFDYPEVEIQEETEDTLNGDNDNLTACYHCSTLTGNKHLTSAELSVRHFSKSDISVITDNEKNSLLEAETIIRHHQSRSTTSLPTAL